MRVARRRLMGPLARASAVGWGLLLCAGCGGSGADSPATAEATTRSGPETEAERGGGDSYEEDIAPRAPLDDTPATGPDGPWASPRGPRTEGQYVGGRRQGRWTRFHDGAKPMVQGDFEAGAASGVWRWWYVDGTLRQEGAYEAGLASGLWRMWRADGALLEEVTHARGLPEGPWRMFHANGQVAEEMTWRAGRQEGLQRDYSPDGALLAEGSYEDSRPVGTVRCHGAPTPRELPAPPERMTPTEACATRGTEHVQ